MHFAIAMEEGFLAVSLSVSHAHWQLLVPGVPCVTPLGELGLPGAAGFGLSSFINE